MSDRPGRMGRGQALRSVLACNVGICFEGFDFIVYSAFASYISRSFFPVGSTLAGTLLTFATFGVSYVVRPVGGIFWGRIADRLGRRRALVWISLVMAVGVAVIAFTPTYAAIGVAAPILVVAGRLVQGFAAGGEFSSATALLVELAPRGRSGLYASTQMATQALTAGLTSTAVLSLMAILPPSAMNSWGWRSVFVVGILLGPIGIYMRRRMSESPEYVEHAARSRAVRLRDVFRDRAVEIGVVAGLTVVGSASFYLIFVFLPSYAARSLKIGMVDAQLVLIGCSLLQVVTCLFAGGLSDRAGRKKVILPAAITYAVISYPCFALMSTWPGVATLLVAQAVMSVVVGFVSGPQPATMSELFSVETRSSGIGIVYNITGAVFGGLGPFFMTGLLGITGDLASPAYWAVATGVIGATATLLIGTRMLAGKEVRSRDRVA